MSLLTGLLAYWSLDGTGADITGAGNDLSYSGAPPYSGNSVCGAASISFSGSGQFAQTSRMAGAANLTAATIAVWLYSKSNTQAAFAGIVESRANSNFIGLGINGSGPQQLWTDWNDSGYFTTTGVTLPLNQWTHVVGTFTPTGKSIYANGQLVYSYSPQTNAAMNVDGEWTLSEDTAVPGSRQFNGLMDEIGIWSRALSDPEIAQLYNNGLGLPYPFNVRRMGRPLGSRIIVP